jgi:hypothetical protein
VIRGDWMSIGSEVVANSSEMHFGEGMLVAAGELRMRL